MKCSKCNNIIADNSSFCVYCGHKIMKCPNCNNAIADDSTFCAFCGHKVEMPYTSDYSENGSSQSTIHSTVREGAQSINSQFLFRIPVKTNYSLAAYILLSLITCGIYSYYFIYKMAKDVNQICSEDGDKVGGLGAYILLSFLTCGIYSIYWLYKIQNRLHIAGPRFGIPISETGTTILLWYLLGFLLCGIGPMVALYFVIKSVNRVGSAYNVRYFYGRSI